LANFASPSKKFILNNFALGVLYWIAVTQDLDRRRALFQKVRIDSGPNMVNGLTVTGFFLGDKAVGS